jgi:cell division protein FtsQ
MLKFFESSAKHAERKSVQGATRKFAPTKPKLALAKILSRLALCSLLLGLSAALVWYWPQFSNRPVTTVAITGELKYIDKQKIQKIIMPSLIGGLLDVPLDSLRVQIEALPWVEQASVGRVWPDGLEVKVTEQQPVARWGKTQLLNNRGQVFAPSNTEDFNTWPTLAGPTESQFEVMQHYLELNRLLQKRGMQLVNLSQDYRGAWTAELKGGVVLVFGRGKLVEKIQRLFVVYDKQLYRYMTKAKKIDLRYRNGIAVQWRQIQQAVTTSVNAKKINRIGINVKNGYGSAVI